MSIIVRTLLTVVTAVILISIFNNIIGEKEMLRNIGMIIIIFFSVFIFASKGEREP